MVTFKQLEALYWISQLGSFEAAALKLNMSQSAISKRIAELEETFSVAMFDRSKRTARLTEKGVLLLGHAKELLDRRDQLLGEVSEKAALVGRFRMGVTELTAMTWLPSLIERLGELYPRLQIEPTVDVGSNLFRSLEQEQLDLVIVPGVYYDARYLSVKLESVANSWMASPKLCQGKKDWTLKDLSEQVLLAQGTSSGSGLLYQRWFANQDISFARVFTVNNLLAQVGLAMSGMGVAYLPRKCLSHLLERGDLCELRTETDLPSAPYIVLYRPDRWVGVGAEIAHLAVEHCNFDHLLIAK
jgi:DNA-binding transcriptional LysR family regulator